MTEHRLIHLSNPTNCKSQRWTKNHLHAQLWGTLYVSSVTTQHQPCVVSLPHVPNTASSLSYLHNEENRGEVQVKMLSQCLKTLPASAETIPHSKLKPVEFCRLTLLYNRWSLSLITGLLFPYNPMVITDKPGCPVTPIQFKPHLNPTPFSPSKVNLCSCQVYTPSCPEWKKSAFLFTHSILSSKDQSLIPGQNYLPEGSDLSNISLLWSTVLLDCNHPPPQETKA